MKTLIIFDIDGTLLYSDRHDSQCFADSYQRVFGQKFPSIDWSDYTHVTDHTIFHSVYSRQFNKVCHPSDIHRFQDDYIGLMHDRRQVMPDKFSEVPAARRTIDRLKTSDNYVLGIATGGWKRPAIYKLTHIGISTTAIYDSYADDKSTRIEILQESIDKATIDHPNIDKVVYVGDAAWDVATTKEMNIPMIGVRREGDLHYLHDMGVEHVIADFTDYDRFVGCVEAL
jgi:phosphoglycolate phosphatase-like HAD superfamily hydrolase